MARRNLPRIASVLLLLAVACTTSRGTIATGSADAPATGITPRQTAFLDTLQRRTFNWFWERTDSRTGLAPDRWPTKSFSSVAAIGFALTAYPIGVERGYVSRAQAAERKNNEQLAQDSVEAARTYLRDQAGNHFNAECVDAFLATPFGGDRHLRRVQKLSNPPFAKETA